MIKENIFELDQTSDLTLRPKLLHEYIGQQGIKESLNVYIKTAMKREESLDHVLFYGPPGLGKTTLASIIANEMNTPFRTVPAPSLDRVGDLAAVLSDLKPYEILFIDEIHRLSSVLEETLYSAMEDFKIDIVSGKDATASSVTIELAPFTLIGATTRFGDISSPLRDRFGIINQLKYYEIDELCLIVKRTALIYNYNIAEDACLEIAKRSRGTPRICNRLFRRVRDYAQYIDENALEISLEVTKIALEKQNVDHAGLDFIDRKYLKIIIENYCGGPVGLNAIAASAGENPTTLEDVCEPYLLKEGYIIRTPKGRKATDKSYQHLGYNNEN